MCGRQIIWRYTAHIFFFSLVFKETNNHISKLLEVYIDIFDVITSMLSGIEAHVLLMLPTVMPISAYAKDYMQLAEKQNLTHLDVKELAVTL